jgi:hypothetical protein
MILIGGAQDPTDCTGRAVVVPPTYLALLRFRPAKALDTVRAKIRSRAKTFCMVQSNIAAVLLWKEYH